MTPEEYVERYNAASSDEERFDIIREALNSWGVSTGVLTASLMEFIEKEDWASAALIVDDLMAGLPIMKMNFIALYYKSRGTLPPTT